MTLRGPEFRAPLLLSVLILASPLTTAVGAQVAGETPLAGQVEGAIDRGAAYLLEHFDPKEVGSLMRGYPLGTRALVAYALLEAGVDPDDPRIDRLFEEMRTLELSQVYGVSLYVLALHARRGHAPAPSGADGRGRTGVTDDALPGGAALHDEIARCIAWLVEARRKGHGSWGYGNVERAKDAWTDYSNTQFAVLALHVGLREGIEIPRAVFEEIVGSFTANVVAGPNEVRITLDRAPWRDDEEDGADPVPFAEVRPDAVTLEGRPMSWAYRPLSSRERRARRSAGYWGTTSMTAAGVSSLLVAQHGLDITGSRSRKLRVAIEKLVDGGVIELSRAWHPGPEPSGESFHRNRYYTLYSFEKAMNLAGIGFLDGSDWYRDQVPYLLRDQRPDGSWGRGAFEREDYAIMATSFALLFLRRATAQLTVHPAAPIATHDAPGGESSLEEGRVWVEELGGSIELDELFGRLRDDRSGRVASTAEQVLAAVPIDRRIELLPRLLPLLADGAAPAAERFARQHLAEWTGLPERTALRRFEEWWRTWERVRALGAGDDPSATIAELSRVAGAPDHGVPLRLAALTALRRVPSVETIPAFLDRLEDAEVRVREFAARALRGASGMSFPFEAGAAEETRATQVQVWRAWWSREGERLREDRAFARLRERLERAETPEERAAARAALVELGPGIVPRIDRILAEGSYAFDWLEVRRALTGGGGVRSSVPRGLHD